MGAVKNKVKEILIVEDNEEMQALYRRMFMGYSGQYTVEIVGEAKQAIKKMDAKNFDLIILDIIMEPIDGETFYSYLRNNLHEWKIPVLVVSVIEPQELHYMKEINRVEFMQKPVSEDVLIKRIQKIIG